MKNQWKYPINHEKYDNADHYSEIYFTYVFFPDKEIRNNKDYDRNDIQNDGINQINYTHFFLPGFSELNINGFLINACNYINNS